MFFLSAGCYFLIITIFFFSDNRANELAELKETKAYYQAQIDKTRKEVEEIRINTASLEKIAREKYMMKKDNEELFIIPVSDYKIIFFSYTIFCFSSRFTCTKRVPWTPEPTPSESINPFLYPYDDQADRQLITNRQ